MNNFSILVVKPSFCEICSTPALYHEHTKGTASGQIGIIIQTLKSSLDGKRKTQPFLPILIIQTDGLTSNTGHPSYPILRKRVYIRRGEREVEPCYGMPL
uniref:Orf37 n=1 Tax=Daucus carota subsp. sativus TaxID=79200 RepID=I1TIE5_DAUCS|nr:orf37 [Daucus carota subsp. sativus]AEY81175.1 orf37 [Daucus carota subsp. sativus]